MSHPNTVDPTDDLTHKRDRLTGILRDCGSAAVAFSGGVDSTVVARAAHDALGPRAVAVTDLSESMPQSERDEAAALARRIGIEQVIVQTREIDNPKFARNEPDRCYWCKGEFYVALARVARERGLAVLVDGANLDDTGDWRPGLCAAQEHHVRHPLQEADCSKQDVRALARHWELPNWDKPAAACLASRIAYGLEVTPERLQRIDRAEAYLHRLGLRELRVRLHPGELARIEVPTDALPRLVDPQVRDALVRHLRDLGFNYVTLELGGLTSGSMNRVLDPPPEPRP